LKLELSNLLMTQWNYTHMLHY